MNNNFKLINYKLSPKRNFDYLGNNNFKQIYVKEQNYSKIFCANCGKKGHIIKNCDKPITSFGIISFKLIKNDDTIQSLERPQRVDDYLKTKIKQYIPPYKKDIKFLMIERKDSLSYTDFIRAKYLLYTQGNPSKIHEKLKTQFSEMTLSERKNLKEKTFNELWDMLWVNKESELYKKEYYKCKKKFEEIDISYYLDITTSKWEFTEFEFPKGRKNTYETNIACAEREFYEETGYEKKMYLFVKDFKMVEERFTGTNHIEYIHNYYIVKLKEHYNHYMPEIKSMLQKGEVKSIGWYNINECLELIRDYSIEKKQIILNIYNTLFEKINNNIEYTEYYYNYNLKLNENSLTPNHDKKDFLEIPILKSHN